MKRRGSNPEREFRGSAQHRSEEWEEDPIGRMHDDEADEEDFEEEEEVEDEEEEDDLDDEEDAEDDEEESDGEDEDI